MIFLNDKALKYYFHCIFLCFLILLVCNTAFAIPQTLFKSSANNSKSKTQKPTSVLNKAPNKISPKSSTQLNSKIKNSTSIPQIKLVKPTDDDAVDLSLVQFTNTQTPKYLSFSLKDIIGKTLQGNISIAVQEYQSKIRTQQITEQDAVFDHNIFGEFNANGTRRQVASAFANPAVSNDLNHLWNLGVNKRFVTGTEYSVSYEAQRDTTNSVFAGLNPQYSSELVLKITQPLLKGFGIDNNKKDIYIASNNLEISDHEFTNKVIDIISNAEEVYWDLVFSIDDLKVKKQSIARAMELERRIKAQVDVGTLAPLEILQAKSEVASREESVLDAEKAILDNEDKLKNIINLPFDSPDGNKSINPLDRPKFIISEPVNLNESISTALTQRPDYLIKKKELDNKKILVKYNKNQLYPALDLVGSFGLNGISGNAVPIAFGGGTPTQSQFGGNFGQGMKNMFDPDYRTWEMGFKVEYPLGNRAAKSRLSASKLEVSQVLLDIKDTERNIIVEVREAVRQINTAIKRVHAARISKKLAEEKLSAEEKKFEVGLSTSFQVLEFQTDLAEEQTRELKAIIDYNKAHISLRKAIASTLDEYNIRLTEKST
jgi:outer membrane protein TolC